MMDVRYEADDNRRPCLGPKSTTLPRATSHEPPPEPMPGPMQWAFQSCLRLYENFSQSISCRDFRALADVGPCSSTVSNHGRAPRSSEKHSGLVFSHGGFEVRMRLFLLLERCSKPSSIASKTVTASTLLVSFALHRILLPPPSHLPRLHALPAVHNCTSNTLHIRKLLGPPPAHGTCVQWQPTEPNSTSIDKVGQHNRDADIRTSQLRQRLTERGHLT